MNHQKLDIILDNISPDYRDSLLFFLERKYNHVGTYFAYPITHRSFISNVKLLILYFRCITRIIFLKKNTEQTYVLSLTTNIKIGENSGWYKPVYIKSSCKNYWGSYKLVCYHIYLNLIFENLKTKYINTIWFNQVLINYERVLSLCLKNCTDIVVDQDMGFFENFMLKVAMKRSIRTHLYFHGLKAWYNKFDEHRVDFLYVWGRKMRDNYIERGYERDKIVSLGNSSFNNISVKTKDTDLSNVLVLTKPINGANPSYSEFHTSTYNCIYYLRLIEDSLKSLGILSAVVRVHPSENPNWYSSILSAFWKVSRNTMELDLEKASICIGPTSTMLLHCLYRNLNYIAFEYVDEYLNDLHGMPIVPPFDKSESRLPVAFSQKELVEILKSKINSDPGLLMDYVDRDFDLGNFNFSFR
jgi:hypothetical protein